ncbi:MAG: UbiA prenyltransferase family protein [Clostridiales bacterium]|jgi:4-hydroxybenzoate polyprenyltransferase|nr:UbiA prenyltransferase family protein [Clostridiales bacterium]
MRWFRLARPKHCVKNLLLLLPVVFGRSLFDIDKLRAVGVGFAAFCLLSSAVYVFNDIMDAPTDRLSEDKKLRPVASGEISAGAAGIFSLLLALGAFCLDLLLGVGGWPFLAAYAAVNALYSAGLKNYPILDVAILSAGFVLRVLYGAAATGIEVSRWLVLTVVAFSLFMGLGKRRQEYAANGPRKSLAAYGSAFLDKNMYMCVTLGNAFYALWAIDRASKGSSAIVWTAPLVILICMRYSLDIESGASGDPVEVFFGDKWLIAAAIVYVAAVGAIIYMVE